MLINSMALSSTIKLCLLPTRRPLCSANGLLKQSTVTTASFRNLHLPKRRHHSSPVAALAVAPTDVCGFVHGLFLGDVFVDAWSPNNVDSQSIASQLFAASLFPYIGFLYHITRSKTAPKLTLFGFYFLLAFVGATIPAGIYAKVNYGTSLANVDWLHGSAEFLLTLTNLFIVLGLRGALRSGNVQK